MASFNSAGSLPSQPILSAEAPFLDFLIPGFRPVSTAILPILAGDLNLYARLVCLCAALAFVGKYARRYLWELVETYFSS